MTRRTSTKGTTIMEIIVVLLVLTILSGVIVAGVATIRTNTHTAVAKSNLERVILMEKNLALINGSFSEDVVSLGTLRGITLVNTASQGENTVSVKIDNSSNLYLAVLSSDGICLAKKIIDPQVSGLQSDVAIPATSPCSADSAITS
jgi:Tfp pilus assembly protein PilE